MNKSQQIEEVIQQNNTEKLQEILNQLLIDVKDRKKSQILCQENIQQTLVHHITEFKTRNLELLVIDIIYNLVKRPSLGRYFTPEVSHEIISASLYTTNFDILRSLTRTPEQCEVISDLIPQVIDHIHNVSLLENTFVCYSIANLSKKYADQFISVFIDSVNTLCTSDISTIKEENLFALGEAFTSLSQHFTNKIKIASQVDEKLVSLKNKYKSNAVLCNIIRDIIQFLTK
ncbi:hypothetical protein EHI8A_085490 [Entamoeba histolytica HM-1:IMSS-B]|uniref:Uncharacterized protein n=2 Tax=Entamoeba histolytica TaxID=5759 RepID=M3U0K5_ENTH1|nr:hypothetical protein EHI8A_085490 [Entamoeba histolytica HM-1:IMSS-B]EMS16905.1 hypothetical protein KM1_143180 [Entamoeba histolytica HM-3:IMSS]